MSISAANRHSPDSGGPTVSDPPSWKIHSSPPKASKYRSHFQEQLKTQDLILKVRFRYNEPPVEQPLEYIF